MSDLSPYRTRDVLQLCQTMRKSQDYTLCLELADSLEAARCPYAEVIGRLRSNLSQVEAQRLVAGIYSDESAAAVAWMYGFVDELGDGGYPAYLPKMTYDGLMAAANQYVQDPVCDPLDGGSMDWSNRSMDWGQKFWEMYDLITGTDVPYKDEGDGGDFFSCTC